MATRSQFGLLRRSFIFALLCTVQLSRKMATRKSPSAAARSLYLSQSRLQSQSLPLSPLSRPHPRPISAPVSSSIRDCRLGGADARSAVEAGTVAVAGIHCSALAFSHFMSCCRRGGKECWGAGECYCQSLPAYNGTQLNCQSVEHFSPDVGQ